MNITIDDINSLVDELDFENESKIKNENDLINSLSNLTSELKNTLGINREFKKVFNVDNIEVLTHKGFIKIKEIGKTVPYLKYKIKTTNHELECADDHLLVDSEYDLIYAKDLNKDSRPDKIITENGPETVLKVINTGQHEEMYDISLEGGSNQLYFTNGILSHNSIFLANDAANFVKMGVNTAFISAEMSAPKVLKRIGANLLSIPMDEYEEKAKNRDLMRRKLETVGDGFTPPGSLFVKQFPTSQATVTDIEAHLKQIEEERKIKLGCVVIDYINILSNYRNPNSENTYLKVKQIAEDLRAMGQRNGWLIVTATQINRCLSLNTIVKHETRGDIEIKNLNIGDRILTNEGYSKVSHIYEKTVQKTFLIKTKGGKKIRASANHIFPILNENGTVTNKKLKNIEPGEKILGLQ